MNYVNKPEICRFITLSNSHISKNTAGFLSNECGEAAKSPLVVYKMASYGWMILVPDTYDGLSLSKDLVDCLEYAKKLECDWLRLDCDGPEMSELKKYEW